MAIDITAKAPELAPIPVFSLSYVSCSLLARDDARMAIDAIVATARTRNARDAITGALLYSGRNFVQVLEGAQDAVMRLLVDIKIDERHHDLTVLDAITVEGRTFDNWSMAYFGDATFVRSHVDRLLETRPGSLERQHATRSMRRLMRELVHLSV